MKLEIEIGDSYLEHLTQKAGKYGIKVEQLILSTLIQTHPLPEEKKRKARVDLVPMQTKDREAEFLAKQKENPAYKHLNVLEEFQKCRTWCETNRQQFSPARVINWLNRATERASFKQVTMPVEDRNCTFEGCENRWTSRFGLNGKPLCSMHFNAHLSGSDPPTSQEKQAMRRELNQERT